LKYNPVVKIALYVLLAIGVCLPATSAYAAVLTTTITAAPAIPTVPGTQVQLRSTVSGDSGSYEYQFYQKINGIWKIVRPYSTDPVWTWDTTGVAFGTHYFNIYARNVGSTSPYETTGFFGYTLVPPAQSVTTQVAPTAPRVPGTPVTLAFSANGGSGSYEYQIYQKKNDGWKIVRPYSTEPIWTWDTTGVAFGTHYFNIYARNAGSNSTYEATGFLGYTLVPPAQSVTTQVAPTAPRVPGTPVTLAFSASGGSGSYEYQIYQKINGSWKVVRPYSAEQSWTWDTTGVAFGTHYFNIYARNAGSKSTYETTGFLGYTLVPPPAAKEVSMSITPSSPQLPGTQITFTAAASGGSGSYEYQFYRQLNGQWTVVQPYSMANSWTWDTTGVSPGDHYFTVYARSVGSSALYDVAKFGLATIVPKAASAVSVTAIPATSQLSGTPITFTAIASGGSGSYEYQFYRQINGQWTVVRPYSTVNCWTWDSTGAAAGNHYFTVYARSLGSTALYDTAQFIVNYIITPVEIFSDSNQISIVADSIWGGVEPLNLQNWPVARQSIYDNITGFLGNSPISVVPLNPQTVSEEDFPDYSRRKVSYQVEPGEMVTAYLLVPKYLPLPRPAILALHQSVPCGKNELVGIEGYDPNQAYAIELVKRGYIVLVPDSMTVGERKVEGIDPFDFVPFTQARPDWSASGKMLWDHQRGIDYLQALPEVDSARIGVIGHSLGATSAIFLAAFDDRIKAVVASCGYARNDIDPNKQRWNFYIPQLRPYIDSHSELPWDMQHFTALIAPRPFFQTFALRDRIFPPVAFSEPLAEDFISLSVSVAQIHKTILPLYLQADKEPLLQTWYYDGPHGFPLEMRAAAFDFLDTYLVP